MNPMSIETPNGGRVLRPLAIGLLTLALAACASSHGLAPQDHPHDPASLQAGKTLGQAGLSPADWPAADWWKGFGDAQLDALVAEGLRNSPSLAAADARLRSAQAQAGSAEASRKPSLSVSGGYTGLQLPESMVGDEMGGHYAGSAQAVLDFSYGVDLWGGKRAAWEAAVDQVHAADVDAQAARLNLSAAIVETYTRLAYNWRQLDVANDELARAKRTLELTQQRRNAGIDSDLQLRQAEARVPTATQRAQSAQQDIDDARNALAALVGQGPDRGLSIERPNLPDPLAAQLPSVLPSELLGHRPDVVAARWRVEAANKDVRSAKTKFYPSFNITALGGVVASDVGDLLKSDSVFGILAPAISLPIFDGGRLRANLSSKDAAYDLAVADYNGKIIGALHEVADQVNAVRSLQARVQSQDEALKTAQAAYALSEQRYRAGIGSFLEVLSVEEQLLVAQQRMAALQSEQILASVRLRQALGGGFAPQAAAVPADSANTESANPNS